jgi:hypothetical protein
VSFTAGAAGTYTLGFSTWNSLDQALNPLLFVDDAAGGTSAPGQPVVSTTPASSITGTSAMTGGNVTSDGGATVTARGVVYSTSPLPTLANAATSDGSGLGSYTSSLSGLSGNTTYYVRAYATNSAGTSYGSEVSFTTPSACIPTAFTTCSSNITVGNDAGTCDAVVSYTSAASNNATYSYTFSGATTGSGNGTGSGATFNKGVTTVTITAVNACGDDQCTFDVTVDDTEDPIVSCPASATVSCDASTAPANTGSAAATDNCSATVSYSDVSGQDSNPANAGHYNYTIARTWTATDAANNTASCVQTITVQDVTAPSVTCPANATVSCKTSVSDNGSATGADNCSSVAISHSDNSTQDANPANAGHYSYTITRTWTATDISGNSSNCAQVITVNALNNAAIAVNPVNTINANHPNHTIYIGYGPQSVTLTASALGGVGAYSYSWSPTTGVANPNSASTSVAPTTTTTYTVTITDGTGCSITQSVTINVVDVRCGNKVKICHFPPGNPGNAQQLCLPASAIAAHLAHGCKLGDCPLSKNSNYEEDEHMGNLVVDEVNVYPNPNNGSFTIELPAGMEQANIAVTDMIGKVIIKQVANGSKVQVDLGSVARGMYMVNVTNGSEVFRTKVSVQ